MEHEETLSRTRTAALVDGETAGGPTVRVWQPRRRVVFGPLDASCPGYERAVEIARSAGFEPVRRRVGGRAVAHTAAAVVFARVDPIDGRESGLKERYRRVTTAVKSALRELGVGIEDGEPSGAYCPGDHSLQCGGKIVGVAQRLTADTAVTSGILLVDDREAVVSVLERIYPELGLPFDPESVGTVADVSARVDLDEIIPILESHLQP